MAIAYLVLPKTSQISITDGQHRRSAIEKALNRISTDDLQKFSNESVAVLITCEMDIPQIHQDFADASKTKPLPPGLLAVYDMRNPANRVVVDLERNVRLFRGRIDSTSKTISKNSSLLFTANQLRQFVKVFLTGSWQMGAADFERHAHELLPMGEGVFERELAKLTEYVNYLSDRLDTWKKVSNLPTGGTTAAQVRDLRQEGHVSLSAMGLVIIARIGHDLFKVEGTDWKPYADRLASLDWRISGQLWRESLAPEGKILAQQALVRRATIAVRKAIGLTNVVDDAEGEHGSLAMDDAA